MNKDERIPFDIFYGDKRFVRIKCLNEADAWDWVRAYARNNNRKLSDLSIRDFNSKDLGTDIKYISKL